MRPQPPTVHDVREPVHTPADGIISRTTHHDDDIGVMLLTFTVGRLPLRRRRG
jgi:hypothetical protein